MAGLYRGNRPLRTVPADILARGAPIPPAGGGVGQGPGGSGAPGVADVSPMALPPHIYPPYGAAYWLAADNASFTGPTTGVFGGTFAKFNTPPNMIPVIQNIEWDVNNLLTSSNIQFQLLINGAPWSGFSNYVIFPRAASSVAVSPTGIFMPVPDGAVISAQVVIGDGGTYQCGFTLGGYFFSKAIAAQWVGQS